MRRPFTRDNVVYTIHSVTVPNGFQGKWKCNTCGKTGGSTKNDATREHAILSAELNTYQHHANHHRPKVVMPVVLSAPKKAAAPTEK